MKYVIYNMKEDGQSLIEIVIAVAVAGLIITATITGLVFILRVSEEDIAWQTASSLQRQMFDGVSITAGKDWQEISKTFPGRNYYLKPSDSEGNYKIVDGKTSSDINGVVYEQFFTVSEVERGGNGDIVDSGGVLDPSTKKIDIFISWPTGEGEAVSTVNYYLTRVKNEVFLQTDWSGGNTEPNDPSVDITNNFFKASPEIDFKSKPGSIRIKN